MLFNSVEFIFVFLPLSLLSFYFVRQLHSPAASMLCLLAASLVFYIYWKTDALVLLAASVAMNYLVGSQIDKARRRGDRKVARAALVFGLGVNLGALGYFKYTGFFLRNLATLIPADVEFFEIALPLGISFFTFTQITFLVDTYRGLAAGRDPLRYALFVAFFPHLIAGPILKYRDIDAQLATEGFGRITADDMALGTAFFAMGLFKKLILADPIGTYVQPVFAAAQAGADMTLWEAWAGATAYTMQIYFDFSGYCDMAIGLGLMFGLRLPVNFDSPYQATSIVDFWRRWHITLSSFLRDYLYIPIGGNRCGPARRAVNVAVTMLLGGLWHGASWTFVFWGGLHAALIFATQILSRVVPTDWRPLPLRVCMRLATFALVVFTWVPFRAESLDGAFALWRRMADPAAAVFPMAIADRLGLAPGSMFGNALLEQGEFWPLQFFGVADRTLGCVTALVGLTAICFFLPSTQKILGYSAQHAASAPPASSALLARTPMLAGALLGLATLICVLSINRPVTFLYFNF